MVVIVTQTVNSQVGTNLSDDCPKSGHFLVEKKVRGGGKQVVCSNDECDYQEEKQNKRRFRAFLLY